MSNHKTNGMISQLVHQLSSAMAISHPSSIRSIFSHAAQHAQSAKGLKPRSNG